jgi:NAD(P) transhydrogenase subunit alpha
MRIAVAREADPGEDRVAATPDTVKKLKGFGAEITIEPGAGVKSGIPDADFTAAGASVAADATQGADVVLKVRRPTALMAMRQRSRRWRMPGSPLLPWS